MSVWSVSAWSVGVWALMPALAVPLWFAIRGSVAGRMVAVQLASAVTSAILIAMSFAFDQDSYLSLAVTLAALNVVGTFVIASAVERWL